MSEKLIQDYLDRLRRQLSELSSAPLEDVIQEIRAHIEDSLTGKGKRDTETVQEILGRLGDPEEYARQLYAEGAVDSGLKLVFCKHCGVRAPERKVLCPNCGRPLKRPLAVSAISIFSFVMGVFMVYVGITVIIMMLIGLTGPPFPAPSQIMNLLILLAAVGVIMMMSGVGLWRMKAWGWWLTIISYLISLGRLIQSQVVETAVAPLQLAMFTIQVAFSILILGYLITRRRYFAVKLRMIQMDKPPQYSQP